MGRSHQEAAAWGTRRRTRPGPLRKVPLLHGAEGRHDGLQEHALPEAVRDFWAVDGHHGIIAARSRPFRGRQLFFDQDALQHLLYSLIRAYLGRPFSPGAGASRPRNL